MPILCFAGKGGTGKTSFAALVLKLLVDRGRSKILAVDANPSANLSQTLGVALPKTIGDVVSEEFKGNLEELPPGLDRRSFLGDLMLKTLSKEQAFDLLVMGRVEAKGCYCLINELLAEVIDDLSKSYDYILMDMEAGLEHISRGTARKADIMVIMTDPSKMGLQTAKAIQGLTDKAQMRLKSVYLVGNMFPTEDPSYKILEGLGIEIAGIVPMDPNVVSFNLQGRSLLEIPSDSPALAATEKTMGKMGLL